MAATSAPAAAAADIAARQRLGRGTAPRAELTPGPSLAAGRRWHTSSNDGRPRRPALPATPRARSRDRCAAFFFVFFRFGQTRAFFFSRPFGLVLRPSLWENRSGSGVLLSLSRGPRPSRLGLAFTRSRGGAQRLGLTRPPKPAQKAPDVLEETATRRGGRGPDNRGPSAGAARSAAGGGTTKEQPGGALARNGLFSPVRAPSVLGSLRLSLGLLLSLSRARARAAPPPKSAARGRHPRALLGPGPAPAPRLLGRTPEDSRGHAAVTQPGSVRRFLPGSGRNDTSLATGSRLERRPPCRSTGHRRGFPP